MCETVYLYVGCSSLAVEPVAKNNSLCCYFRDTVDAGEMMCYKCKHYAICALAATYTGNMTNLQSNLQHNHREL